MTIKLLKLSLGSIILLIFTYINNVKGAAVMSVDLGSEWMKVGVISPGVPMDVALNKESKRITPSVIAYHDNIRSFGEDAQNVGIRFPADAYGYLVNLLGKTIDSHNVELFKKRFPQYEIIGDGERNTVVFKNGDQLFRVEELVAQLLNVAREFAQNAAKQSIKECVLVVPGYFGQAERIALLTAAQLIDLKVLQLINAHSAVALYYGVLHHKFNETVQNYIFYDMGAEKTIASLVSYQNVKDKVTKETNPVIQILNVTYDRTLGGLEIQLRLRDYLAREFNKMKKTKTDVFTNPRSMAKLFKEAGRLKKVLSANTDHYAQVEGLIEEIDFKLQVTRETLEEICSDLWPRVQSVLQKLLDVAKSSSIDVNQVILFGGGIRMPMVQKLLREISQQELGKSLNADESAALGAVYKGADLTTGFKVKKFIVKDAVIYPIEVVFDKETEEGGLKQMRKILFGQTNPYPQKKVIKFNRRESNFDFYVNYVDLSPEEAKYLNTLNISHVELKNVADVLEKHKGDNVESRKIQAHFALDDSGIVQLTKVDFVFEKQQVIEDESTLSKLGNTIGKFFSGDEKVPETDDQKTNETNTQESDEKVNATTESKQNAAGQTVDKEKNETVKILTVKESIEYESTDLYGKPLTGEAFTQSHEKINEINKNERARYKRESTFNALESYIIETRQRLSTEEYSSCATEEEKKNILEKCSATSEWLDDEGFSADLETIENRLDELKKLTHDVYGRYYEHLERPDAIKTLEKNLKRADEFLKLTINFTKDADPSKDIISQIDTLRKTIDETIEWKNQKIEAQNKLKRYESVELKVKDIHEKIGYLGYEVNSLSNKIKIWESRKPLKKDEQQQQEKEKEKEKEAKSSKTTTTETVDDDSLKNDTPKERIVEIVTEKPVGDNDLQNEETLKIESKTKERDTETSTPHGEL